MLIKLELHYRSQIITTYINLNKICHIQSIQVLNVNNIIKAIKPTVHLCDRLNLLLTKMSKEAGQAVGYLEDGTMVVVDNAKKHIGEHIDLEVVSLLQTSSGRIIFAKKIY